MDLKNIFFKLMNNANFQKIMENVRKHKDMKLLTTKARKIYLVSESNYHTKKAFCENQLAIEMRKIQLLRLIYT